jgi:hypothetical protein
MEGPKPTIDERLDAIGQKLELLTVNVHVMQELQRQLDLRERRGRRAIAEGICAYFKALNEEPDESYGQA